jgi:hypothetical protein
MAWKTLSLTGDPVCNLTNLFLTFVATPILIVPGLPPMT